MKKVLLIETLSQINGGQKMSLLIADMLRTNGKYDVKWAIPEEGILSTKLKDESYQYYLLGNVDLPAGVKGKSVIFQYGWMSVKVICKLLKLIRKEKIDIIYAPGPAALPWSAVCGTLTHKPVIWHLHHIFLDRPTKKLLNICSGFRSVKRVVAVSNVVGNQIENSKTHDKVKVLYNPVDYQKYSSGNVDKIKDIYPFSVKFSGGGVLILEHIGIIHPTKRQDFTIELIGQFKRMGKAVHAVFIGNCGRQEQTYMDELLSLSRSSDVVDRVHFVGYQQNVEDWLSGADAVIIPSIEGMPLAALEAMASGTPVVATEMCGAGELIRESNGGVSYTNTESQEKICKRLLDVISDDSVISSAKVFAYNCDNKVYSQEMSKVFDVV